MLGYQVWSELTLESWQRTINVNLTGYFVLKEFFGQFLLIRNMAVDYDMLPSH